MGWGDAVVAVTGAVGFFCADGFETVLDFKQFFN